MMRDPPGLGPRAFPRVAVPRWLRLPRVGGSDEAWALRHDGTHAFVMYGEKFCVRFRASDGGAPSADRRRIAAGDGVEMWLEGDQTAARAQIARRLWDGLAGARPLLGRMLRLAATPPNRWQGEDLGPLTAPVAIALAEALRALAAEPAFTATDARGTETEGAVRSKARGAAVDDVGPLLAADVCADSGDRRLAAALLGLAHAAGGHWHDVFDREHAAPASDAGAAQVAADAATDAVDALVTGRGEAAVAACARLATHAPELLAMCADTLIAAGRVSDAAAMVLRLPAPAPPDVRRQWRERAAALYRAGDHDGAEEVAAAAGLDGTDRAHWHTATFEPPIDAAPDRRAAVIVQSRILFEPPDRVITALRGLRAEFPDSELLHTYTGELFLWQGDHASARDEFATAVARYDRSRWAHVGLATVAMLEGDLDAAAALLDKLDALVPPSPFATTHMIAGEVALCAGDLGRAEAELRIAVDAKHTRFAGWLNLAEIHRRQGNVDEAARCLAAFNRLAPGAIYETTRRLGEVPTVTVGVDALERLWAPLLETFRGNRSSGFVTFVAADGTFRVARPDLRFVQLFAAAAASQLARDPEFVIADIGAWLQARRAAAG